LRAGARVGGREAVGVGRAFVDRRIAGQGDGRGDVVDGDRGAVVGVAAVLVVDPARDVVGRGTVGERALVRCVRARGREVGPALAVVAVGEAGGGVGRARVGLVREADRRRRGLVDRAIVAQVGRRGDVVDRDVGRVLAVAAVL